MNKDLMANLECAYEEVARAENKKRACENIQGTIRNIEKDKRNVEFKNILIYRGVGIAAAIVIIEMLGSIAGSMLVSIGNYEGKDWLLPIIIIPTLLAGVIVGVIVSKIVKKKLSGNLKKFDDQIAEQQAELNQAQTAYNNMIYQCKVIHSFIPPQYLNTATIQKLYNILQYGRADSWKEALNVLEMDLHNKRMEDDMKHNVHVQEQMLKTLKNTEYQAQKTADMVAMQNLFGNNNNNNNNF